MEFYSQSGEDYILYEFFDKKTDGIAIDIGALEGIRFSNTYIFDYFLKWKTICVEPHNYYYDLLTKNRNGEKTININEAVSNKELDEQTFFTNFRGGLSTLDKSLDKKFETFGKYFGGFEEQKTKITTLNRIIEENLNSEEKNNIDFISIDVEGTEIDVLKGFDIEKYGVKIYVIEENSNSQDLINYFESFGYCSPFNFFGNMFFSKEEDLEKLNKIRWHTNIPKPIIYPHPLDTKC